jgi:predicted lipid-binding transport protein (Tim44 family)
MNRQVITSNLPQHWSDRLKGAQFGFLAGLAIGLIFGWFFHGIISVVVRLGVFFILLLPLIVIGWLWFRSRRAMPANRPGPSTEVTWTAIGGTMQRPARPAEPPEAPDFTAGALIDVPVVRRSAEARPDDIEAELQALKRQQERGS